MRRLGAVLLLISMRALTAPPPSPPTFDQIKSDANAEHRARLAIDFAMAVERDAEAAYTGNDLNAVKDLLRHYWRKVSAHFQRPLSDDDPASINWSAQHFREIV